MGVVSRQVLAGLLSALLLGGVAFGQGTGMGSSVVTVSNVLTPPVPMFAQATASTAAGVTPTGGGSGAVSSLVVRSTTVSANLYSVRAANVTATAGTIILYANTATPATGALNSARIYGCKHIAANGDVEFTFNMPLTTALGLVILVSSATDCATYTTGVVTATIYAQAQ